MDISTEGCVVRLWQISSGRGSAARPAPGLSVSGGKSEFSMGGRAVRRRGTSGRRRHVPRVGGSPPSHSEQVPCLPRDAACRERECCAVTVMEAGFVENALMLTEHEPRLDAPGALRALDPPPPDVLIALLARNKALEGNNLANTSCSPPRPRKSDRSLLIT